MILLKGEIMNNAASFIKHNLSGILTALGTIGFGVTVYLVAKEASKVSAADHISPDDGPVVYSKKDTVIKVVKNYAPAIVSGGLTLTAFIGAQHVNVQKITALSVSYAVLGETYKRYKDKIKEVIGEVKEKEVEKEIKEEKTSPELEEEQWFYEEYSHHLFKTSMKKVLEAEYEANKQLALNGDFPLLDFLSFLGFKDADIPENCKTAGWDCDYMITDYEYPWIDFDNRVVNDPESENIDFGFNDGRRTTIISYPIGPLGIYKETEDGYELMEDYDDGPKEQVA
jgi:hypothetical protein